MQGRERTSEAWMKSDVLEMEELDLEDLVRRMS